MSVDHPIVKIGVDIVQPIVPEYRVALFDGLAESEELDVAIQASERLWHDLSVPLQKATYDYDHRMLHIGRLPLFWQCGLLLKKARKRGDVLVVCGDLHQVSTFLLILRARAKGIGVVWWGHHRTAFGKSLRIKIRLAVARFVSDVVLCYTDEGIRFLEMNGFKRGRVFATGNTIDQEPIVAASARWHPDALLAFQKEQGLEHAKLVVFCSMLRKKTQLDVLIRAMATTPIRDANIVLAVIGDGEMRREYEETAARVGVSSRIRWLGVMQDQNAIAPWFLSARAFVYPGAIGLSLLHAFSYGLPVVTHGNAEHQMPEFAALVPGENGLVFREGDANDLAVQLGRLMESDVLFDQLSSGARKTAMEEYSMPRMIARFKEAIMACSRVKSM